MGRQQHVHPYLSSICYINTALAVFIAAASADIILFIAWEAADNVIHPFATLF